MSGASDLRRSAVGVSAAAGRGCSRWSRRGLDTAEKNIAEALDCDDSSPARRGLVVRACATAARARKRRGWIASVDRRGAEVSVTANAPVRTLYVSVANLRR